MKRPHNRVSTGHLTPEARNGAVQARCIFAADTEASKEQTFAKRSRSRFAPLEKSAAADNDRIDRIVRKVLRVAFGAGSHLTFERLEARLATDATTAVQVAVPGDVGNCDVSVQVHGLVIHIVNAEPTTSVPHRD